MKWVLSHERNKKGVLPSFIRLSNAYVGVMLLALTVAVKQETNI